MSEQLKYDPKAGKATEIGQFFETMAGGFKRQHYLKGLEYVERYFAVMRGNLIKKGDTKEQLARDLRSFIPEFDEENYSKFSEAYQLPEFSSIVSKDGKVDSQKLHEYMTVVACNPTTDLRDYSGQQNDFQTTGDRIIFTANNRYGYDPEKIVLAWAGKRESPDFMTDHSYELPYAHIDDNNKIKSKTVIKLTQDQLNDLMKVTRSVLEQQNKLDPK